jgi:ferric-dicitrate binding protein FerR (iron transport regulator)
MTVTSDSQITLVNGLIYLDKPPGHGDSRHLRIATRVGLIEHLGTEFEVMSNDQAVRIRVREGQVRFSCANADLVADAGTELLTSHTGTVTQRPIPTYGHDWLWIAALTPNFAVEGQSLMTYLQWVSRELGRALVFANDQARDSARLTILHGSTQNQASLDALADVLSTTTLSYELAEGTIRVHSN